MLMITALMVAVVLLLIGMGLLGSQVSRYEASRQQLRSSQARQLALAGLEDARIKLELDIQFPPSPGPGQHTFSYSEKLDTGSADFEASYSVVIDLTYATDTAGYIEVVSVGTVGPPIRPLAQYRLRGEIDNVTSGRPPNAYSIVRDRFFRYTHVQDEEMP